MDLYPQGAKGRPSVLYVPIRPGPSGAGTPPPQPGVVP